MVIQNHPEAEEAARLTQVADCLRKFLKLHGPTNQAFGVLRFLADKTLERLSSGKDPKFNNLAIQDGVAGAGKKDPSAWLSPLWKRISTEILPSIERGLQEFARGQGLTDYPWVTRRESTGGAGNQALYYIEARELPQAEFAPAAIIDLPRPDISYIPVAELKPSWWARWFFDRDHSASGWRKGLIVWTPLVWFLLLGLLAVLLFLLLSRTQKPVTTQDLMAIALLGALAWWARRVVNGFTRLVDDRITMAPDAVVGFKEFGVCLELVRTREPNCDVPSSLRLVKYAGECPICRAEVLLDPGEPDFPRRLVGRCQESPREHVFSFDRVSLRGYRLR